MGLLNPKQMHCTNKDLNPQSYQRKYTKGKTRLENSLITELIVTFYNEEKILPHRLKLLSDHPKYIRVKWS